MPGAEGKATVAEEQRRGGQKGAGLVGQPVNSSVGRLGNAPERTSGKVGDGVRINGKWESDENVDSLAEPLLTRHSSLPQAPTQQADADVAFVGIRNEGTRRQKAAGVRLSVQYGDELRRGSGRLTTLLRTPPPARGALPESIRVAHPGSGWECSSHPMHRAALCEIPRITPQAIRPTALPQSAFAAARLCRDAQ